MTTSESARYLMARTNLAFEHPELAASLGDAAKCWSCKIGLNVGLGAVIAAAIAAAVATGGLALIPEVAVIAAATGLSEAVVVEILSSVVGGTAAVELMIEELCKAMGHIIREIPYIMVILWGKTFGLRGVAILYYEDLF